MMTFLEAHHRSEDVAYFPAVLERDPGAGALIDEMISDHEGVATAIAEVQAAASSYARTDERAPLVEALSRLTVRLLPHLQREEDEILPVMSRTITDDDFRAIEQEHNLDGKSMAQLGREGHWLIDDASTDDRAQVLGLVPAVPRLLLVYGFGPSYRRDKRACWNPNRRRVQRQGSTVVVVDADIDAVWDIVRDPTRVGEWSHECVAGTWVDDATEARPGARFRGRNKQGIFRWGRLCEVVSAEPYELVWRTVPTRLYADSSEWALRLSRVDSGTRIEQTFELVQGTWLEPVFATILPAHRDRTAALIHDLERIGALAAGARVHERPAAEEAQRRRVS